MKENIYWIKDYLKDDDGNKSHTRLLNVAAYPPATIVLLWIHTAEALGYYLSAFVVQTGVSKGIEAYKSIKMKDKRDADSDN